MKKCLSVFLVSFILLVSYSPAMSADWVFYAVNMVNQRMFFDADSIAETNGHISVWERQVYDRPELASGGKKIKEIRTYNEVDCSARTLRLLKISQYYTDGGVDTKTPSEIMVESVLAGSMDDRLIKAVCEHSRGR